MNAACAATGACLLDVGPATDADAGLHQNCANQLVLLPYGWYCGCIPARRASEGWSTSVLLGASLAPVAPAYDFAWSGTFNG